MREPHPQPKKKRGTKIKRTEPNDGEGVAVDEEGMYSDTDSLVAPSDSSYDSDLAASLTLMMIALIQSLILMVK